MGYTNLDYGNDEFRALISAVKRYAEMDLDQWAAWRLATEHGEVFVTISRSPGPGRTPDMFDAVAPDMPLREDVQAGLGRVSGQVLPEHLQDKAATFPETHGGVQTVTVTLRDGFCISGVELAWASEVTRVRGHSVVPFDVADVVDVDDASGLA